MGRVQPWFVVCSSSETNKVELQMSWWELLFLLFLFAKTEIVAFIMLAHSEINKKFFYIHSKVFLSIF